jgi:hypothetical protein
MMMNVSSSTQDRKLNQKLTLVVFEEMLCDVDEVDMMPPIESVYDCAIKTEQEAVSESRITSTQESLSQLSIVKDEEGRYPCNS